MILTIKKIHDIVGDIVTNHKILNDFGEGDPFEINTKEHLMPLTWIDFLPSDITRNKMEISFRIYVMDLVDKAKDQRLDVKSDTLLLLNDIITNLRVVQGNELIPENFRYTATPFEDEFNDEVTGWYANITIDVDNVYGECDIPN